MELVNAIWMVSTPRDDDFVIEIVIFNHKLWETIFPRVEDLLYAQRTDFDPMTP